jgi:hypothetical protein
MKKLGLVLSVLLVVIASCQEDIYSPGSARLAFRLTDAPASYDKVFIDLVGAQAIINDSIIDLDVNAGIYNLLDFTNGKDTLIVDQEIPSGTLSQIRLILGSNNTLKIGANTHDLKTPSAQQSGLKLNIHADFQQGVAYEYMIDFDAARSIVATGGGKYILKPVMKVFTKAVSGSLTGVVSPAAAKPLIYAISSAKDSSSTYADAATGSFRFIGLAPDTYKLSVLPLDPYKDTLLTNIQVKVNEITKLDTIRLK